MSKKGKFSFEAQETQTVTTKDLKYGKLPATPTRDPILQCPTCGDAWKKTARPNCLDCNKPGTPLGKVRPLVEAMDSGEGTKLE
jgi:hypothetical protein